MLVSSGFRWAVCLTSVGQHFLADAGCLYAQDESDNIFSLMKAARMRKIFRTLSRACRLPVSAGYV